MFTTTDRTEVFRFCVDALPSSDDGKDLHFTSIDTNAAALDLFDTIFYSLVQNNACLCRTMKIRNILYLKNCVTYYQLSNLAQNKSFLDILHAVTKFLSFQN